MNRDIGSDNYNIIKEFWKNSVNIKIRENSTAKNNRCVIYASSNGIWNPNTIDEFNKSIIKEDRYEWETFGGGELQKKEIFIRDILKEWYVNGVSNSLNSIDKLVDFLKKETKGYQVVTVGNSAGGYIAAVLGIILSAEYILDFSGQNNIWQYVFKDIEYPELYIAKEIESKCKYFNIVPMIKESNIPIFYFFAASCEQDIMQYSLIREFNNVHTFAFRTKQHGVSVYPFNLPVIINMKKEQLLHLKKNDAYSQREFAYITMKHTIFWVNYIKYWIRKIPIILKRMLKVKIKKVLSLIRKKE